MQKQYTLIVTVLFLAIACLSGCTQPDTEREKFIGTWVTEPKSNPIGEGNYTDTRTFYANDSYVSTNIGIGRIPGTWYLSDGKLIIDTYFPGAYQYSFSQNNTVLTLVSETTGFIENLTRQ
jgi:hypothetical protein